MNISKKTKPVFIIVMVLIAAGAALWYFKHTRGDTMANQLIFYGNVDIRQVQLAFNASARIEKLLVQEGDQVQPGQQVAELDPIRYQATASQATAEVAVRKQVLARLLAGSRPEEVKENRARVKAAESKLEDARLVYNRTQALYQKKTISDQRLDDAAAAYQLARAEVDAARQALALSVKGPREEDIAAARAQVDASQAALKLAERELADTKLYAPASGIIENRILEPGDMAFPQTPVLILALTDPVWIQAYVSEPDLGKIAPGMSARVTTDSYPDKAYRGWIGFISPTAEFTPKEIQTRELRTKLVYRMRVYVCNPKNELRLGMPVTVTVPLGQVPENFQQKDDRCQDEPDAES